ncbi:hypothetical protein Tco_1259841 [Tanacetum coccineum]
MFHSSQAKHVPLHLSETCFHLFKRNMLDSFEAKHDRIMNPQETLQAATRDEKWVPSTERVKISSTNIRLETTMSLKSLCSNSGTPSRRFKNKKYTINAEVFRTILNICPRVEGEDFTDVPDDDIALTFLIDLGYKGPLNRHTNMFVDHMHQPWRTLATIINKCLSGKIASNDKLKKSKIDILWGMFNRENVDYPELIWEDSAYQIDHRKEKRPRRENMPYPRFTKIIINHFLKQHKSLINFNHKHYHTIKDDGIISRLKFVRICEDYQEYGHPIPDVMLTDAINHSESYQMFIKYSTNQIPPKKSKESGPEPKPAKKKTASKRVVKKKVTLSADDNIISDDPDAALELAKYISQTEAEEAEAARKVHATHARIVIEYVPEFAKKKSGGRSSKSIVIQDTPSAPKLKPATSKSKLKGAPSLTLAEQEAANIMQALKESKNTSRRQPGTGGSNEGTGSKPRVPNESTVVSATSSEGTGAKLGVPDEDKDITKLKDDKDSDADDEGNDHVSDTQDANDEDVETEFDEDDIYKYKIRVCKDEDVEMKDAEVKKSDKGEEKVTGATKEEDEKTSEAKYDTKKSELPPSSSSLSVSSGFSDQFLKLSSDSSLLSTVKDSADADVSSLLDIPIQHETPQIQSPSVQKIPVSVIPEITNLQPIPEIVTETPELQKHTADLIHKYSLQHLPELTKKPTPTAEQESEKSPLEILKIKKEQAESQKNPQFAIKSTDKAALEAYDLKSALYQSMHANKSFNRNFANHRLYYALMEALIEDENTMDKGVKVFGAYGSGEAFRDFRPIKVLGPLKVRVILNFGETWR